MKRQLFKTVSLWSGLSLAFFACGKESEKAAESAAAEVVASNGGTLAASFPGSLALSVLPQNTTTSTASLFLASEDLAQRTSSEKLEEAEKILKGTADSCAPKALAKAPDSKLTESCYEFDQDMIYGGKTQVNQTAIDYLGTQNGLNSKKEACLVAFTRAQISDTLALVDQTLGLGMAALCQAQKTDATVKLPEAGATLDLKAALTEALAPAAHNANNFTVTAATMERLSTDNDARPVYRTLITVKDKNSRTRSIGIVHSPDADQTNETYNGTIYVSMDGDLRHDAAATSTKSRMLSIVYAKTTDRTKAELRTASVDSSLVSKAFNSAGVLDFNAGAAFTAAEKSQDYGKYTGFSEANDAMGAMTFISFDINPDTNEGNLAYWRNPGGNYYENARGFNLAIAKNSEGQLAGCATSGAASIDFSNGTSIRRYLKEGGSLTLAPKGFWHPFFNDSTNQRTFTGPTTDTLGSLYQSVQSSPAQTAKWYMPNLVDTTVAQKFVTKSDGSLITKQCFKQNATSGLYEIDSTKTSEKAGFELIDTGVTENSSKLIAPPDIKAAKVLPMDIKK